ncbi:MAG TPA: hypothetical protein VN673_17550 [Clostridia bacterium]|nr:hypothetical protein [Clostridia bacterium]
MEPVWHNRFTGQACQNPEAIPFLGLWHSNDRSTWPGSHQDLEQPAPTTEPSEILRQSLTSLAAAIRRLFGKDWRLWADLVPLDPTITSELNLRDCEKALVRALPHLETLSHNPRSHLTIEEVREQVGRARRVSHRAIAALAAHSEDWQTRTFLGVRPRRVLAESRQDQWDIYENRAVATLRKRVLGVLHPRLQWLNHILQALDEASEHSEANRGTRFRRARLYQIWGEIFKTHPSRDLLAKLISDLDAARARLLALADTHLFKQMPHFAAVESPLHSTNVFQSDPNYRQAFDLWHRWERHTTTKPPTAQERAAARRRSIEDWDLFVILLTLRACRQLGFKSTQTTSQPMPTGQGINLQRGWSLAVQPDRSLLLYHLGTPLLQVAGLYCCLGAQAEKQIEAALQLLCESRQGRPPLLLVTVHDPESPGASHSVGLAAKLQRLRNATLLSDRLAIAEASPLRIDSTELIARAIHWVTAEHEWPRPPIREQIKDWDKAWPELPSRLGMNLLGRDFHFLNPPPDSLIAEADNRAQKTRQRFKRVLADRDQAKQQERRSRGDRRDRADVNLQKKELAAEKTQEGNLMRISDEIHASLLRVRDKFRMLQECPCCRSEVVDKQKDALIMACRECETQWGRRVCASCHKDYAFIVPRDSDAVLPPEVFDSLRIFGADICAEVLPPISAPYLPHDTACPHCSRLDQHPPS